MLTVHQLWLLLAVDAGVAIAGTLVVARLVGFFRGENYRDDASASSDRLDVGEGSSEPEGATGPWHDEAAELAREVRRTASALGRSTDPDRVSRRLIPLSARIRGHVRSAPVAVNADVYRRLYELGVACQRVAVEGRPADGPRGYGRLQDRLEALCSEADDFQRRAMTVS